MVKPLKHVIRYNSGFDSIVEMGWHSCSLYPSRRDCRNGTMERRVMNRKALGQVHQPPHLLQLLLLSCSWALFLCAGLNLASYCFNLFHSTRHLEMFFKSHTTCLWQLLQCRKICSGKPSQAVPDRRSVCTHTYLSSKSVSQLVQETQVIPCNHVVLT